MRWIGVHAGMPQQRNRELRSGDWKRKTMHADTQDSGVPLGNTGDQVRGPGQSQRGREATDGRDDIPIQSERFQGFLNGSHFKALT